MAKPKSQDSTPPSLQPRIRCYSVETLPESLPIAIANEINDGATLLAICPRRDSNDHVAYFKRDL